MFNLSLNKIAYKYRQLIMRMFVVIAKRLNKNEVLYMDGYA